MGSQQKTLVAHCFWAPGIFSTTEVVVEVVRFENGSRRFSRSRGIADTSMRKTRLDSPETLWFSTVCEYQNDILSGGIVDMDIVQFKKITL